MKRIKPEELVKDQKYLVELKFKNDDGSDCLPLKFENTENEDDYDYFERDVKIYSLDENDKVIIPKFVAGWLESQRGNTLRDALDIHRIPQEVNRWLTDPYSNQEKFAHAWINGYEFEEEKLYWVRTITGYSLLYKRNGLIEESVGNDINSQEELREEYTFTEKEIKDYDERYWAFAVPVEEE